MTRDEIEKLSAGPDLDALIAEHIFCYNVRKIGDYWHHWWPAGKAPGAPLMWPELGIDTHAVPRYSQTMEAAWKIVGRVHSDPRLLDEGDHKFGLGAEHDWWYCNFGGTYEAHWCTTPEEAICKAALMVAFDLAL